MMTIIYFFELYYITISRRRDHYNNDQLGQANLITYRT